MSLNNNYGHCNVIKFSIFSHRVKHIGFVSFWNNYNNRRSIKQHVVFACKHRPLSMFARVATAFRSSRSNKELIEPLLKPSAITGDYGRAQRVPRNFALLIIGARDTCFMARKLRALPFPMRQSGASRLRGSPNRTAHWRKVRPYKQSQGRAARFMMAARESAET